MGKGSYLGELEELILLAVLALGNDAYGFAVQGLLRDEAGRQVSLATAHSGLYRLEKKGFLRSRLGGATDERGGRSKRLFSISAPGLQALDEKSFSRAALRSRIAEVKPV